MSRNVKILLVVVGSLLLLCILACGVTFLVVPRYIENTFSRLGTPEVREAQAKQVGAQIADYTVPPGYQEEIGFDMIFEKIVGIGPVDNHGPMIMMISVNTPSVNRQQMEQQLRQSFSNQFSRGSGVYKDVGTHPVTIKGEQTNLSVSETDNSNGVGMRQAMGVFQGKSGL